MIYFSEKDDNLLLIYQPDRFNDLRWLDDKLEQEGRVTLRRTFTFTRDHLESQFSPNDAGEEGEKIFVLGALSRGYYKINKEILGIKHDLMLDRSMKIKPGIFIAQRDISVFRKIDKLIDEPIVVGGENEGAIPLTDFERLLKTFPTSTELNHYTGARITRVLKDYFGTISDAEGQLNHYLNSKNPLTSAPRERIVANYELQKFEYIRDELKEMLEDSDSYTEKDWQKKILDLLLFIYPRYIAVLENVHIKDFYSNPSGTRNLYIDLLLVDVNGNTDIIEVKKPFAGALLSCKKYRNSYTPKIELAGAIMQAEKYLFHMNKWGRAGEKEIYEKRRSELPPGLELKITNPKALILLGRDNDFTSEHRFDFEIIRRKYANMLDIMTYDDLLRRIDNILFMINLQIPARSGE